MWLIIDDERTLGCEVIARTAEAGMAILDSMPNCFECLCIDHDLGGKLSGYDVLKWALKGGCCQKHVQIVSQNPVGVERMRNLLRDYGYTSVDLINWTRTE